MNIENYKTDYVTVPKKVKREDSDEQVSGLNSSFNLLINFYLNLYIYIYIYIYINLYHPKEGSDFKGWVTISSRKKRVGLQFNPCALDVEN